MNAPVAFAPATRHDVQRNHAHGAFRPDIEGLRCLAVLPVVLFHAGLAEFGLCRGGFVGVDIFFVISGYLISGGIYRDFFGGGRYSIADFYARRVRRIFPALFVVYVATLLLGAVVSLPVDLAALSRALLASIGFVSNWHFAATAGYFDHGAETNALLHTWSLSVEEQFYIVMPLLLLVVRPFGHRLRVAVLVAVLLGSLAYSEFQVRTAPSLAYYDLFGRIWELMAGALLAIIRPRPMRAALREALAFAGLALVLGAIFFFAKATPFPGLTALVPCLGTVALLQAGSAGPTRVGQMLSLPVPRFFGKISYSLYLWHWPLIVFWKLAVSTSLIGMAVVVPASVLFALVSWTFVEQPFRTKQPPLGRKALLGGAALAMALTASATVPAQALNRALHPATARTQRIERFMAAYQPGQQMREGLCFTSSRFNDMAFFKPDLCLHMSADRANVLLFGDSHAAQYQGALDRAFPGANMLQATSSGCRFAQDPMGEPRCRALWDLLVRDRLARHPVDAIVIGQLWRPGFEQDAVTLARRLQPFAREIYILGPNLSYPQSLPRLMLQAEYRGEASAIRDRGIDRAIDSHLARLAYPPHAHYLSWVEAMCHPQCPVWASDGNPALSDENHLTSAAAADAVQSWIAQGRFAAGAGGR